MTELASTQARGPTLCLQRVSTRPFLALADHLLSPSECDTLAALCADDNALRALAPGLNRDTTGKSAELAVEAHPLLQALRSRIEELLGERNALGQTFRLRVYTAGQGHPPHLDDYEIDGMVLVATALVGLRTARQGGETVFLDAAEGPLALALAPGELVYWRNLGRDGEPDPSARHLAAPVVEGEKMILGWFVYAPRETARNWPPHAPASGERAARARRYRPAGGPAAPHSRGLGRVLAFVDDGVPAETRHYLAQACEDRCIAFLPVHPLDIQDATSLVLRPGDMLYRPAVSSQALRAEQLIWQPEVATFYRDPGGPLFINIHATATFTAAGLCVPRTFVITRSDRAQLRRYVEELGGFPVVLKALGYSRGVGVIKVDSWATLFSVVDYALATSQEPLLCAFIDGAVHWRFVVVGNRCVAGYRNVLDEDDFRTSGSDDVADYQQPPPPGAEELAVAACHALRHDHGGVDILAHPSGRLYLLESNFPCYYAQAQEMAGVDVAGAMVDHLLDKAVALSAQPSALPWPALRN